METNSGQEKQIWSNAMIDDMIDIVCSNEIIKKEINFQKPEICRQWKHC